MTDTLFAPLQNGRAMPLAELPELTLQEFRQAVIHGVRNGRRLACLCADRELHLYAVLAADGENLLLAGRTRLERPAYPALTPECPQAHLFERELAEQFGIRPEGHPWFKPVRYHRSWAEGADSQHECTRDFIPHRSKRRSHHHASEKPPRPPQSRRSRRLRFSCSGRRRTPGGSGPAGLLRRERRVR